MILGLNVYHGDSSVVALGADGPAGLEEERLRREKHWAGFPAQALALLAAGDGQIEAAAVGRKPGAHLFSKARGRWATAPSWRTHGGPASRTCSMSASSAREEEHVDGTGWLQTVDREANPLYFDLISKFDALTGVPVVLNTSFNENEPIVCKPEEALDCFHRTKMDALALGSFWLHRDDDGAARPPISESALKLCRDARVGR